MKKNLQLQGIRIDDDDDDTNIQTTTTLKPWNEFALVFLVSICLCVVV